MPSDNPTGSVKVRAWKLLEANGYAYLEAGDIVQWLTDEGLLRDDSLAAPQERGQGTVTEAMEEASEVILKLMHAFPAGSPESQACSVSFAHLIDALLRVVPLEDGSDRCGDALKMRDTVYELATEWANAAAAADPERERCAIKNFRRALEELCPMLPQAGDTPETTHD